MAHTLAEPSKSTEKLRQILNLRLFTQQKRIEHNSGIHDLFNSITSAYQLISQKHTSIIDAVSQFTHHCKVIKSEVGKILQEYPCHYSPHFSFLD